MKSFSNDFIEAVKKNDCVRYAIIFANGYLIHISDQDYVVQSVSGYNWGEFSPWGAVGHIWGQGEGGEYSCIPCVIDWGETVTGADPAAIARGDVSPSIQRSFVIARNNRTTEIFNLINNDVPENVTIKFFIVAAGETVLEDDLLLQNPISYSEDSYELNLTAVGRLTSENIKTGTIDPATGEYLNIVIGDIGYVPAVLDTTLGDNWTTTTASVNSGASSFSVSNAAVLAGASSVVIDYETVSVSSIAGNVVNLSTNTTTSHLSGAVVYKSGSTFKYNFGPGPVSTLGNLQVLIGGEFVDYDDYYSISNSGSVVYVTSQSPLSRQYSTGTQQTTTRTVSGAYLSLNANAYLSGGDIYFAPDSTGTGVLATLQNFYISQPTNATFISGYADFKFSLIRKSNSTSDFQTQSGYADLSGLTVNNTYSSVVEKTSDNKFKFKTSVTINAIGTVVSRISNVMNFGINSFPTGSKFESGHVTINSTLYGGSGNNYYGSGGITYKIGGFSDYEYWINGDDGYVTINLDSLEDANVSNNSLSAMIKTSRPGDGVTYWYPILEIVKINSVYMTVSYTVSSTVSRAVYLSTSQFKILGQTQPAYSSYDGDVYINKTVQASSFNDFSAGKNSLVINYTCNLPVDDFVAVDITSVKLSCTYFQTDFGYPARIVYDPATEVRIKVGDASENVNPIDAAEALLAVKKVPVHINKDTRDYCWQYYDDLGFTLDGYMYGDKTILENLYMLMAACHFFVSEAFGELYFFINKPKETLPQPYYSDGNSRVENSISVEHQDVNDITNILSYSYDANYLMEPGGTGSYTNIASVNKVGQYENDDSFEMPVITSATFAALSAEYKVDRNCYPFKVISWRELYSCYGLIVGDVIGLYSDFIVGGYACCQVVSITVKRPTYSNGEPLYEIVAVSGGTPYTLISTSLVENIKVSDQETVYGVVVKEIFDNVTSDEILDTYDTSAGRWGTEEFPLWGAVGHIWGTI